MKSALIQDSHLVAETLDGFQLPVMGNLELPEEIPTLSKNGADGIGLYRTEFQYLSRNSFPGEQELFAKYQEVVVAMAPKPVTIRTLDINGDKSVGYASSDEERNPALGLRGIRYCLHKTEVFKTQLRAILRAAAFGYVRIMFPMISACHELRHAKRLLSEVADDLEREGTDFNRDVEIGILLEVPSALIMADVMAEECDFFSIGTNDLIQYIFAIDRENKDVLHLYDPLHPAIIRIIKQSVTVAREKGVKIFMCGEMAGEPRHLPLLLGLGIDELSMNPQSIPAVKKAVRTLSVAEARRFVDKVSEMTDPQAISELVEDTYGKLNSHDLYADKFK